LLAVGATSDKPMVSGCRMGVIPLGSRLRGGAIRPRCFQNAGERMAKEELLEFPGVVTELLPNATFRVKLENEHAISAHAAGPVRKNRFRVWAGEKVLVEMPPYDLTKGRIPYRLKYPRFPKLTTSVHAVAAQANMIGRPKLFLASGSPRRVTLINQAGIEPDALRPANVDETPRRGQPPPACAHPPPPPPPPAPPPPAPPH